MLTTVNGCLIRPIGQMSTNQKSLTGDRLLARANFAQTSLVPLEGAVGEIHGIPQGYSYSDLIFHMNMWDGGNNNGEFWIKGSYFYVGTPPVAPTNVGNLKKGVPFTDSIL